MLQANPFVALLELCRGIMNVSVRNPAGTPADDDKGLLEGRYVEWYPPTDDKRCGGELMMHMKNICVKSDGIPIHFWCQKYNGVLTLAWCLFLFTDQLTVEANNTDHLATLQCILRGKPWVIEQWSCFRNFTPNWISLSEQLGSYGHFHDFLTIDRLYKQ